jgi:fructose-1,6-bisphosphatase/inositol monophosphatase family enzyme
VSVVIDRTQYNLLANDDGSNTVGSVWDKNKVKVVLLDPIDALVTPSTVTLADGATPALNAALAGLNGVFRLAAAGDRTIAVPTNPTAGQKIVIQHYASGGSRTLSLNSGTGGFRFGTDVTALTATASGKTDYIGCIYNDTDNKWDVVAYMKGF